MAKTVGQILEDVKDIDTIIQCFRAVCYPNKTEEDVKKALRWVLFVGQKILELYLFLQIIKITYVI